MRVIMRNLIAICFLTTYLAAQVPDQNLVEVSGQVVALQTGQPLERVDITLTEMNASGREWRMTTTNNGQFRFDVPKGQYRLSGERNGIPRQVFGQASAGFGSAIFAGRTSTAGLQFSMFLPGTIRGIISDEGGEPASNVSVRLVKIAVLLGKKQLVEQSQVVTDDRGDYRFTGLAPGKYLVGITGRPWYSAQLDGETAASLGHECFIPMFYPNVTVPNAAHVITLNGGDEFAANMVATIVPASNIRLSIGETPENAIGLERGQLTLRPANTEGSPWLSESKSWEPSSVMTVPYGDYDLEASGIGADGKPVFSSIQVRANAPEIELQLSPKAGMIIRGTLSGPVGTSFAQIHPLLFLQDREHRQVSWASLTGVGSFAFQPIAPGHYKLNLLNAAEFYIDDLQIDGQEQRADEVKINAGHVPTLRIHVSDGAGKVEGVVRKNGMPVIGALVVLVRKRGMENGMGGLAFQTDSDGSFAFGGLRPDDYILFTSSDLELEYADPEFLQQIKSSGVPIAIAKGATVSRNLTLP